MSIGFTVVGAINEQEQHITLLTLMMIMINVQQAELIEQMYPMQIHLKHLQLHCVIHICDGKTQQINQPDILLEKRPNFVKVL